MGGDHYELKKEITRVGDVYKDSSEALFDEDEYEHFEPIRSRSTQFLTTVNSEALRLLHRIGRGPFGDVWLAALHSSNLEFDEYHEVAVKVLPPHIGENNLRKLQSKLESIFSSAGACSVSWPRGFSMKEDKACIITNLYECSVGEKMARNAGNCIPLSDAVRYGINVARGVMELHSRGIIALNLKPCNFLVDNEDEAVLGEFGIPYLLMESVSKEGPLSWLGTPNYMAPEQWDAKLRGPITKETDSWGFACSLLEMITGEKPWNQMTVEGIFGAVVMKREKPSVPTHLPLQLQKMLKGCFEYDSRNRPTFPEIVSTLMSCDVVFKEGDWVEVSGKIGIVEKVKGGESVMVRYCDKGEAVECSAGRCKAWRNSLQVGDRVRVKSAVSNPKMKWKLQQGEEGTVSDIDRENAALMVKFEGSGETFKVDPCDVELVVEGGIGVGDWVTLNKGWSVRPGLVSGRGSGGARLPSCMGLVHGVTRDGRVHAAFVGWETLLEVQSSEVSKVSGARVGEYVRIKDEISEPRFEWMKKKKKVMMMMMMRETAAVWETGRIFCILPSGALVVDFPGRLVGRIFRYADPEEVEIVRMKECGSVVEKYEHLQAMHWAVGPALCLLGFLAAARVGAVLGSLVIAPLRKKRPAPPLLPPPPPPPPPPVTQDRAAERSQLQADSRVWLPPAVANILFKEESGS